MTPKTATTLFLLAVGLAIAVYDLAAYLLWGSAGTITGVVRAYAGGHAWLGCAVGLALAALWLHLFRGWL